MIERINFIEKSPFKFTYNKLIRIVASIVAVFALISAVQFGRVYYAQRTLTESQRKIEALKQQRQALLKEAPKKLDKGPNATLKATFQDNPEWASLINDITDRLPTHVWLNNIKAVAQSITVSKPSDDKKKKKDKNKKEETTTKVQPAGLTLSGQADEMANVWKFYQTLAQSPYVKKVRLSQTKKVAGNFTFNMECDIIASKTEL